MEKTCQRKTSDRRGNDRRITNMAVDINRRNDQRRTGFDRRELASG
tara:strand:+ start:214 stop:351 length:138 start_codon:yes stop_codon:yes gene_type:complete